jgi:uncharacterized protein YcbX
MSSVLLSRGKVALHSVVGESARRRPLRTLATYRKQDGEVMFDQNVVHLGTGHLAVGTPLLV